MSLPRNRSTGAWLDQDKVAEVKRFDDFVTVDWVEDELVEHRKRLAKNHSIQNKSSPFKDRMMLASQTWLVLAMMGVAIGLIAGCLNIITAWLASLRLGYCLNFYLNESFCCLGQDHCDDWHPWLASEVFNYAFYVGISLVFALAAVVLVKVWAPAAAGLGILEIKCIVSGFGMKGFLGWWTLAIKSIGLPLAISAGLSVGKEGPSVHYAVCVGNCIAKLFDTYRRSASKAREFLTATSAAGVAVAFGSPMGGVLFSIEEISSTFQLLTIWKLYVCALIAVATLAAMNPFRNGQLVLFEVTYDTNWHYFEIPIYIVIGVFGGVYGIVVLKLNKRVVLFRKRFLHNYAVREVVVLAVLTACICYFNEFLRLDMTESMQILFHECDESFSHDICNPKAPKTRILASLLFATVARMLFTIITYGCKVPAGIFVPSMAAGATFGRALGLVAELVYENNKDLALFSTCPKDKCIIGGTYAFLGAGAALSGITHLTVTVVIVMFELTGALRYIVPTMIVVAVTKAINDKWGEGGIADQMIKFNGLPLIDAKDEFVFNTTVEAAMAHATVVLPTASSAILTKAQIKNLLDKTNFRGFPVVTTYENPRILGYVSRLDLEYALTIHDRFAGSTPCQFTPTRAENTIDLSSIVKQLPLTINVHARLEYVLDIFVKLGPRLILVEDAGQLVGIVTRKDMLRYEYTMHAMTHPHSVQAEQLESRVWGLMGKVGTAVKRVLGRATGNEYRFLGDR